MLYIRQNEIVDVYQLEFVPGPSVFYALIWMPKTKTWKTLPVDELSPVTSLNETKKMHT